MRELIAKIPLLLDRVQSVKFPGLEATLAALAESEKSSDNQEGFVTAAQAQASASLKVQSDKFGSEKFLQQMDKLAIQYDTIRAAMRPGGARTQEMTKIIVQMRALSQSVSENLDSFKSSSSPGARLAAVAIMQMQPNLSDISWLKDRFSQERPFVFYHSALALENVVNSAKGGISEQAIQAAREGFEVLSKENQSPDQDTIDVLQDIISKNLS